MRSIWVVMVIALIILGAVTAFFVTRGSTGTPPPVGTFLYLWYGSPDSAGLGTPGWNSSSYPGGGAVVDKPTIGFYSSDNNDTFAWQLSQMRQAGFSFAVVSWWGPSNAGESGMINKVAHDLFSYLKSTGSTFKLAIMVDAYNGSDNLSPSTLRADYGYVYDSFVNPYGGWYFEWGGKPLLLFFNPIYPAFENSSFTVRTIGNRPNPVNWTFWDAPAQYFQGQAGSVNAANDEGQPTISLDGEVTLVPRIDSFFNRGYQNGYYLRFDANLSEGMYQEQWNYVLNHTSSINLVLVYGWNEYHERTAIEPHWDYTSHMNPDYLVNLTASYIAQLG